MQVSSLAAASEAEAVPGSHPMQVLMLMAPYVPEYVPLGHALQFAELLDPSCEEYVPCPHSLHDEWRYWATNSLNVPGLHDKHMLKLLPPLTGCTVPAGHGMHVPFDVAPSSDE